MKSTKEIRPMDILKTARWLTLSESCIYALKSINTLKKFIMEGKIYGTKKDGEWTVDRESIDRWFNEDRDKLMLRITGQRKTL